ncbi:ABC transporter substrate-binding protein [Pusillimonas sp. CC-YST705]|uniref:ABC transporter substrate-binding protein n=1 Tax=Mesopusillimonas faecipullorum TaxID=2755040 RepID=A0ABS8CEB1_9BURK|nr:ABC transporter substrate-binding protein [Mesopusillimonas faecipullorum]MCB5364172.1 ABC transporter substrate-binding protein [Mesopusillimonas faecipullorum]
MQKNLKKLTLALAMVGFCTAVHADVKVGFMATLSGASAEVGQDQLAGFQLALDQLGGKLGGVPATLVVEDDQLKPETALNGLSKLLERDKVDVVTGLTFANILMALQPRIAAVDVPFIGTVAGPSPTAGAACKPNLFIASWQSDVPAEAMGKYLNDQGVKRVSTLTPNFVGGKDKVAGFKHLYKGAIADEIYTPLNQLDFSAELTQVASSQPDAIFSFYPGALAISFVRQYGQAGMNQKVPLYMVNAIEGSGVAAMGDAVIGAVVGDTWTPGLNNEQTRRFVTAYQEKYGKLASAYAAFSYDAAMILDAAIRKLGGDVSDKKALAKAIKEVEFQSLRGNFKFGNNNYPVQDYHIFKLEPGNDGKPAFKMVQEGVLRNYGDRFAQACKLS